MSTLKPNSFKVREASLLRKKRGLAREMETLWNREIPEQLRTTIAWSALDTLVSDLSEDLDPAFSEAVRSVIANGDVLGYLNLGASWGSVQMHPTPRSYFAATQVLKFLKKFSSWRDDRVDPLQKAISRFHEAETLCGITNKRFLHYRKFDFVGRPLVNGLRVHEVFHLARRKIQSWIGECKFEGELDYVRHGPGGSVGLSRPYTTPYFKLSTTHLTVSTGAYFYALRAAVKSDAWIRSQAQASGLSGWDHPIGCIPYETKIRLIDQHIEIADYNKVTFVPKDATTHRAIAVEPLLNVALQLPVGRHFRECLRKAGCDLRDQTRNQELARIGTIQQDCHDPVTLDLRMASDTLSLELVRELLPPEWFDYLSCLRPEEGKFQGKRFRWKKFSCMGNGFTFELESMIFYALAQSVSDILGETEWFSSTFGPEYKYSYVSVFGDDIIVPKRISQTLISIFRFCGFQTNLDKTFTDGPFRESCGKDYFNGILVRPFLLERPLSQIKDLIHLLNNIKIIGTDFGYDVSATETFVRALIPRTLEKHLRGPRRTTGDTHIWSDPDECHSSFFVVWDTDMQTFLVPEMRASLNLQKGSLIWRYCQFLYSNTGARDADSSLTWSEDQFRLHISGGGSAGDVVLSGQAGLGRLALTT